MGYSDTKNIVRALRKALPPEVFAPASSRLLWVPVHLAVVVGAIVFAHWLSPSGFELLFLLPVSILVGMSFAGFAFVAHEALHGALTRDRRLRKLVGYVGFFPFWVAPRLWIVWHNGVHHGNTNVAGRDPDAYPTLDEYRTSAPARWAVILGAPRLGKWRGAITFLLGFTLQSLQVLFWAKSRGHLARRHYIWAWVQTLFAVSFWATLAVWLGGPTFFFVYVVPLLLGNAIVMAHIVTNHSLNPLVDDNDALASSLTVTVPRWFSFYTLGFGYHVEHHLFPAMSHRHGPLVQRHLRRVAPDRYQEMPLTRALSLVWRTPRVYADMSTLLEPETGRTESTLGVRGFVPLSGDAPVGVLGREFTPQLGPGWQVLAGEVLTAPRLSSIPPPPAA